MADWSLTRTERQTALFLLKGLSHKEIAALTERSERTVRQNAVAVYRKSGLSGRAELSAFFLEDFLASGDGRAIDATAPRAAGECGGRTSIGESCVVVGSSIVIGEDSGV